MHVLAISGSLRSQSSNGAVVHAVGRVLPAAWTFNIYDGLAQLPAFNPDLDIEPALAAVAMWRAQVRGADAVVISSPEYAHGVPGVLKNALDWLVGSGEFMQKPVAIVNVSGHSQFVIAQLRETLEVMMARVVVAESLDMDVRPSDAHQLLENAATSSRLGAAIMRLLAAVPVTGTGTGTP